MGSDESACVWLMTGSPVDALRFRDVCVRFGGAGGCGGEILDEPAESLAEARVTLGDMDERLVLGCEASQCRQRPLAESGSCADNAR